MAETKPEICAACHQPVNDAAERLYFATVSRTPADNGRGVVHRACLPFLRKQRAPPSTSLP